MRVAAGFPIAFEIALAAATRLSLTVKQGFDLIILGGGAAGLMCAIEAGKRGRHVAVLERAGRMGKKILISGGGRCNFTNLHCQPENFISANPHFAKSALALPGLCVPSRPASAGAELRCSNAPRVSAKRS